MKKQRRNRTDSESKSEDEREEHQSSQSQAGQAGQPITRMSSAQPAAGIPTAPVPHAPDPHAHAHSPPEATPPGLGELIDATAETDLTVVIAGDGPSRPTLEAQAEALECDVTFLGFLDREELPAFYSALDVFVFPGRLETQGLVALEANACGTPVVAAAAGALTRTVMDGETGYHYPPGETAALREAIDRTLTEQARLRDLCLRRREMISATHSLAQLRTLYDELASA